MDEDPKITSFKCMKTEVNSEKKMFSTRFRIENGCGFRKIVF